MKRLKKITSKEFDKRFDSGEDMGDFLRLIKKRVKGNKRLLKRLASL